jgi:hypothetical protein
VRHSTSDCKHSACLERLMARRADRRGAAPDQGAAFVRSFATFSLVALQQMISPYENTFS